MILKKMYKFHFFNFYISSHAIFRQKACLGKRLTVRMQYRVQYIYTSCSYTPHIFFSRNRTSSNRHETVKQPAADTVLLLLVWQLYFRVPPIKISCKSSISFAIIMIRIYVDKIYLIVANRCNNMIPNTFHPFKPRTYISKGRMTCSRRKRKLTSFLVDPRNR